MGSLCCCPIRIPALDEIFNHSRNGRLCNCIHCCFRWVSRMCTSLLEGTQESSATQPIVSSHVSSSSSPPESSFSSAPESPCLVPSFVSSSSSSSPQHVSSMALLRRPNSTSATGKEGASNQMILQASVNDSERQLLISSGMSSSSPTPESLGSVNLAPPGNPSSIRVSSTDVTKLGTAGSRVRIFHPAPPDSPTSAPSSAPTINTSSSSSSGSSGGDNQACTLSIAKAEHHTHSPGTRSFEVCHTKSTSEAEGVEEKMQRIRSNASLSDDDCCPTCLEEYDEENPRIRTHCNHHFHLGCIYEWAERSELCPVCGKIMSFHEK